MMSKAKLWLEGRLRRVLLLMRSGVGRNSLWLYLLEGFNTAVPLLLLPYLTRTLGPAGYGEFAAALNFAGYAQVLIFYGFELYGARRAAVLPTSIELSRLFTGVVTVRLLLAASVLVVLGAAAIIWNPPSDTYYMLLLLTAGFSGFGLQGRWLFQGKQRLEYVATSTILLRVASIVAILLLVTRPSDAILYAAIYGATQGLIGIFGLLVAIKRLEVKIVRVSAKYLGRLMRDAFSLFLTSAMTRVLSSVGITVLAVFGTAAETGAYAAVQKIPAAMLLLFSPLSQSLYPHFSAMYPEGFRPGVRAVVRSMFRIVPAFIGVAIVIAVFSSPLIHVLLGSAYVPYANLVLPLLAWFILSLINNFFGIQILVASGHAGVYSRAFVWGLVAVVVLSLVLGATLGAIGVAMAALLAELLLMIILGVRIVTLYRAEGQPLRA